MKIVILDGYVINPGDASWDEISALGELVVYDRTPIEQIVERAKDAEAVFINKAPMRAEILKQLPKLKFIGVLATGYDVIDLEQAGKQGIAVCNVVAYGLDSVAQQAMALLLELCRRTSLHDAAVKAGEWASSPDWCFWKTEQVDISGKTMGIVGFGNIGRRIGELAHAFGLEILALKRGADKDPGYRPFAFVSLDELLSRSDVISLNCPLTEQSRGMINRDSLSKMKRGAIVINTARGPLVNEADVAEALHSGRLAGYGADVLSKEPASPDNPLLSAPNTLITPHIAAVTRTARGNIIRLSAVNLRGWVDGKPVNVVNAAYMAKNN